MMEQKDISASGTMHLQIIVTHSVMQLHPFCTPDLSLILPFPADMHLVKR